MPRKNDNQEAILQIPAPQAKQSIGSDSAGSAEVDGRKAAPLAPGLAQSSEKKEAQNVSAGKSDPRPVMGSSVLVEGGLLGEGDPPRDSNREKLPS